MISILGASLGSDTLKQNKDVQSANYKRLYFVELKW